MRNVVGNSEKLGSFACLALATALVTSCSMKDSSQTTLTISVPGNSSSAAANFASRELSSRAATTVAAGSAAGNSSDNSDDLPPTSIAGFSCYGVTVSAPDMPPDNRLDCTNPADAPGLIVGLIPAGGADATLSVTVPTGAGRVIRIFGLVSQIGCPDLTAFLNSTASNRFNGLGSPYLVASTTTDVYADTAVSLTTNYDPTNPKQIFQSCSNSNSPNPTPTSTSSPTGAGFPLQLLAGAIGQGSGSSMVPVPLSSPTPLIAIPGTGGVIGMSGPSLSNPDSITIPQTLSSIPEMILIYSLDSVPVSNYSSVLLQIDAGSDNNVSQPDGVSVYVWYNGGWQTDSTLLKNSSTSTSVGLINQPFSLGGANIAPAALSTPGSIAATFLSSVLPGISFQSSDQYLYIAIVGNNFQGYSTLHVATAHAILMP